MTVATAPAKTKRRKMQPAAQPSAEAANEPTNAIHADITWMSADVALERIVISPLNPRRGVSHTTANPEFASLVETVQAHGILEPVLLRRRMAGESFELLAGTRRFAAALHLKLDSIPARHAALDDAVAAAIVANENFARADLSPREEAATVRTLIEAGHSLGSAALVLGKSTAWMAGRNKLRDLIDDWWDAYDQIPADAPPWSIGHLIEVAKLPPALQTELLASFGPPAEWSWDAPSSIADLCGIIERMLRQLQNAPWKLDDAELLPAAGPCNTCEKRSGAAPLLWPEMVDPKEDRCLDGKCFDAKQSAFVDRSALQLKDKTGFEPIRLSISGSGKPANAVRIWDVEELTANTPGSLPAIHIDGRDAGKTIFVKPFGETGKKALAKATGETPAGKSLAVKKTELNRRRLAKALELFRAALDDEDFAATEMSDVELVKLAYVFGVAAEYDGWKLFDRIKTAADAHQKLWESVRATLQKNLLISGPVATTDTAERLWKDVLRIGALVHLKPQHFLDEAIAALPEPKAWKAAAAAKPTGKKKL